MASRPQVIAFDVMETMFSIERLRPRIEKVGLPPQTLELWFAHTLRDGFALAGARAYTPFRQVAIDAFQSLLLKHGIEPTAATVTEVMDGFKELEPYPDAGPAVQAVRAAGLVPVTLTNGEEQNTRTLLERSGLLGLFERVFTVDEVHCWKPDPAPYHHVANSMGVEPGQLALVAVHSWDILGANQAGLTTGWSSRLEKRFSSALGAPDVSGGSLPEVVTGLLALG